MERYQDYVIQDGKFIGKFEEMYQKFEDPWHQIEAVEDSYARQATLLTLKNCGIRSVLEVGCGLGGFTNYLHVNLPEVYITGMDISETAIEKAKETYCDLEFFVENLCQYSKSGGGGYDAYLFAEIMWYILDDLDVIIKNFTEKYKGKFIIINQTFYPEGQQKYGRNYFANLNEMINYLPWKVIRKIIIEREDINTIETHSVYCI